MMMSTRSRPLRPLAALLGRSNGSKVGLAGLSSNDDDTTATPPGATPA